MRKIQKILTGTFLAGVLLGGIGTGIAMAEYASMEYGGEKIIGEEHLVTRNFDFNFQLDGRKLEVLNISNYGMRNVREIEVDNSVPVGTVRYEVTYNEDLVTPYLEFEEYEEEQDLSDEEELMEPESMEESEVVWEEQEIQESSDVQEDSEAMPGEEGESPTEMAEPAAESQISQENVEQIQKEAESMGYLRLTAWYDNKEFKLMMENKNDILEELKQKKISNYEIVYITDVKIKINEQTIPYIETSYIIR